jgi:hypothetical protein
LDQSAPAERKGNGAWKNPSKEKIRRPKRRRAAALRGVAALSLVNSFAGLPSSYKQSQKPGELCRLLEVDSIALKEPKVVHAMLPRILTAADAGSIITKDHAVGILAKLATMKAYRDDCISLLLEELMKSPNNQFPMYVEKRCR